MSCILRIAGEDLNIDLLLSEISLEPDSVWRRGEPRSKRKPEGKLHEFSGASFIASNADFSEFKIQVEEVTLFLAENRHEILRMVAFPGVEDPLVDFGVEFRDVAIHCDLLPISLLREAVEVGISVLLSYYPCPED